jgi:hypothetical protein
MHHLQLLTKIVNFLGVAIEGYLLLGFQLFSKHLISFVRILPSPSFLLAFPVSL